MENYIICIGGFLAKQFSFSYNKVYLDILNNKKAEDNSSAFLLLSGKRDSNSQHSAWKADALPIELFPRSLFNKALQIYRFNCNSQTLLKNLNCGESRIRTCEGETNGFTVRPRWPLEYLPNLYYLFIFNKKIRADGGIRTHDLLITNQLLWPTELHRHIIFI